MPGHLGIHDASIYLYHLIRIAENAGAYASGHGTKGGVTPWRQSIQDRHTHLVIIYMYILVLWEETREPHTEHTNSLQKRPSASTAKNQTQDLLSVQWKCYPPFHLINIQDNTFVCCI